MICNSINSVSYADSNWIPGWLPIRYSISSNKWPVNTFDDVDTVSGIVDNNGFAKVTLSSTSESYVEKEYIKISSATDDSYDGVWQILQLHSSTVFTISANYSATATGSFQRYYRNYHFVANVYAGIRAAHSLAANDPIALVGVEESLPGTDNISIINISSYIRDKLSPIKNELCTALSASNAWMGNDTNLWTSFYIATAESYDVVSSGVIITYTSSFADDMKDVYDVNLRYAANAANPFQNFQGKSVGEYAIQDTVPDEVEARWMTDFEKPVYFHNQEFDLSVISAYDDQDLIDEGFFIEYVLTQYDSNGDQVSTETEAIDREDEGVYRFAFSEYPFNSSAVTAELYLQKDDETKLTETKTITIDRECTEKIYLRWFNQKGAWEGWQFQAWESYGLDTTDRKIARKDIYEDFDTNFVYGTTQDFYYDTQAKNTRIVSTQFLTKDQIDNLIWLRVSNAVEEIFTSEESGCTRYKHKTVLIDKETITYRQAGNGLYTLSFSYHYTDAIIIQGQ